MKIRLTSRNGPCRRSSLFSISSHVLEGQNLRCTIKDVSLRKYFLSEGARFHRLKSYNVLTILSATMYNVTVSDKIKKKEVPFTVHGFIVERSSRFTKKVAGFFFRNIAYKFNRMVEEPRILFPDVWWQTKMARTVKLIIRTTITYFILQTRDWRALRIALLPCCNTGFH